MAKTIVCPIRLVFGVNQDGRFGFSLVYERSDGSAGYRIVWYPTNKDDKGSLMHKVRFTNRGESRIVWEAYAGVKKPALKEIIIRRDAQIKMPRKRKLLTDDQQPI